MKMSDFNCCKMGFGLMKFIDFDNVQCPRCKTIHHTRGVLNE